jgi:hypothetical protein
MAHVLRTMQLGVVQPQREPSGSATSIPSGLATPTPTPADVKVDMEFLLSALNQINIEDPATLDTDEKLGDEPLGSSEELNLESDGGEETPYPHIFVIGDAADAFNALKAGHNAYYQVRTMCVQLVKEDVRLTREVQGELAARNIIKLIRRQENIHVDTSMDDEPLEKYTPNAPAIKVSLGLVSLSSPNSPSTPFNINICPAQSKCVYQTNGVVGVSHDNPVDQHVAGIWGVFGVGVEKEEDMYA